MSLTSPDSIDWLHPWYPLAPDERGPSVELQREVGPRHPLFGVTAVAVARRSDCDDVLFALEDCEKPLAVVHLTWSGWREPTPQWPWTEFYSSWADWVEQRLKPDHHETSASG